MDESNQASQYEQMHEFANQSRYVYEEGVTIEIQEIFFQFQQEGKVKDCLLVFDDDTNHYKVLITLEKYSLAAANSLFDSLFRFIGYLDTTLTVKKETERGIHYEFASLREEGIGFYCEVDLIAAATGTEEEERQKEHGNSSWARRSVRSTSGLQSRVKWKFKVDSASLFPLIATQDIVYAAYEDGGFYAIDATQGTLRWQWKPEQHSFGITSLPAVDNGTLFVPVHSFPRSKQETSLYAIAAQSGQLLKRFPIPSLRSTGFDILTVSDEVAYLSGADRATPTSSLDQHSICLAIDLRTEVQKWVVDLGHQGAIATPVGTPRLVYLTTFDARNSGHQYFGHLHALDTQTGKEMWKHTFERGLAQSGVVAGTEVFVVGSTLEVLDAITGTLQWSLPGLNATLNGPLTVNDEMIYISYQHDPFDGGGEASKKANETILAGGPPPQGEIMAVDRASRQLRWRVNLAHGHSFIEKPMISGTVLYTTWKNLDMRGCVTHATLFALDVYTGQEYWRFEADDLSSPLVINDLVFIQGIEGKKHFIYALFCQ